MLFLWAGGHGHGDGRDVRHGGQGPQREAREEGVHQGNANIILIKMKRLVFDIKNQEIYHSKSG